MRVGTDAAFLQRRVSALQASLDQGNQPGPCDPGKACVGPFGPGFAGLMRSMAIQRGPGQPRVFSQAKLGGRVTGWGGFGWFGPGFDLKNPPWHRGLNRLGAR